MSDPRRNGTFRGWLAAAFLAAAIGALVTAAVGSLALGRMIFAMDVRLRTVGIRTEMMHRDLRALRELKTDAEALR